jgi:curved DNA-binding protein CbpA
MTDYFAALGQPRRPWLDPENLRVKFVALSAEVHPDHVHCATEAQKKHASERYAELNAAYSCLRDPKQRLFHLLTLERGTKLERVQPIGPGSIELFNEVSQICRKADAFLSENAKTNAPLLKARLLTQATVLTEELSALRQHLHAKRDALVEQMKLMNMAWETAPSVGTASRIKLLPCGRVEQLYRDFSYISRWLAQIEERFVALAV